MPISSRQPPASSCCAKRRRACAPASQRDLPAIRRSASSRRDEVARLPEHSLDLVVLHSVAQYLTAAGTGALFALFHRLLKSDGLLVVGDVIPPHVPAATDAWALLRFAAANGFLLRRAVAASPARCCRITWRLRSRLGLTRYDQAAMIEKLAAAGFAAQRAPKKYRPQPGAHDLHRAARAEAIDLALAGWAALPSAPFLV